MSVWDGYSYVWDGYGQGDEDWSGVRAGYSDGKRPGGSGRAVCGGRPSGGRRAVGGRPSGGRRAVGGRPSGGRRVVGGRPSGGRRVVGCYSTLALTPYPSRAALIRAAADDARCTAAIAVRKRSETQKSAHQSRSYSRFLQQYQAFTRSRLFNIMCIIRSSNVAARFLAFRERGWGAFGAHGNGN